MQIYLKILVIFIKKMKQKGFAVTTLIIIVSSVVVLYGITATGVVLYKQDKLRPVIEVKDKFFDFTSDIIYNTVWKSKDEKKMLEQELEFSNIKREQAEGKASEEAIARAQAEEKAQQEEVLKNQAEAKAKQEEYERKLKEQQLSEKEAEERKMNADNDYDGLTYREELNLGSSDWDNDSDGDGIKDGEDMHPAGGDRLMAQHFEWDYSGTHWTWDYSFLSDWYDYYKNMTHGDQGISFITSDNFYIQEIAAMLKNKADVNNYTRSEFAVSFIQSLGYVGDNVIGYDDYPKYPLETLGEQNGDCEDTSYLAASIIDAMNIDVRLILLPGHMAIAVAFNCDMDGFYYRSNGRCYYYVETTVSGWSVGDMPDEYINYPATLVSVYSGKTTKEYPEYNKPCYYSSDPPGYYSDGSYFYSDSNCNNVTYCIFYDDFYFNYLTEKLYWDSSCSQIVTKGCYKSDNYPGYFYDNDVNYYNDSRCLSVARFCRPSSNYSDTYYDGYNEYWDSNCTQKVVSWCSKSIYHPGYWFSSIDYEIYIDSQCTQKANL